MTTGDVESVEPSDVCGLFCSTMMLGICVRKESDGFEEVVMFD